MQRIRLVSRGSQLALWQSHHVRDRLRAAHPDLEVEVVVVKTTGDRITDVPLSRIGDKGLFTKEVDDALLDGRADAAVHSLKDVPTRVPPGLELGAIVERVDPRDVFLAAPGRPTRLADLAPGARVGTSSLRRRSLLGAVRPDLVVEDFRGNLDSRLQKLREGRFDAAILALAGIRRLGLEDAVGEVLQPPGWLPAVGQGALGITIREGDAGAATLLAPLEHAATRHATTAERAFLRTLEGGCQVPIGALAETHGSGVSLSGFVASLDGRCILRDSVTGAAADAAELGRGLAERLLDRGAGALLAEVRAAVEGPGENPPPPAAP
ncbi:MAG: hydroxymethylbilane synthase [Gemmatimonadota bacterium]